MRAWQLGVIMTIIGVVLLYAYYAYAASILNVNINSLYTLEFILFFGFLILFIGILLILLIGIGILGIKLRQWVEHH